MPPGTTPQNDGDWARRRAAAVQAYREWMPSGLPDPSDPFRIWRTVPLGSLADLVLLDTRLAGREQPVAGRRPVIGVRRRDRALIGPAQWEWLEEALAPGDGRAWALVASQVVTAPIHLLAAGGRLGRSLGAVGGGLIVNSGQWDGYPGGAGAAAGPAGPAPG